MQFLKDKTLIVGIGSSGQPGSGMVQRVDGHIGKIIRINRDGTVPADNAIAVKDPDAKPELWATGFRSPGGFALDDNGQLWVDPVFNVRGDVDYTIGNINFFSSFLGGNRPNSTKYAFKMPKLPLKRP